MIIEKQLRQAGIQYKLLGTLLVSTGLMALLVLYSLLLGWNALSLFIFWFLLVPGLTVYLPLRFLKRKGHLFTSLSGLVIFYGVMVWMIYDHYQTDYFQIMMISFVVNMALVTVVSLIKPLASSMR